MGEIHLGNVPFGRIRNKTIPVTPGITTCCVGICIEVHFQVFEQRRIDFLVGLLVDPAGLVSLVVARASAAGELGISAGTAVVIADLDGTETGAAIPVSLGRSRAG